MPSSLSEIATEITLIMPRISRKILCDTLQDSDISHAQLFVVGILFHNGPTGMTDLVRELKVAAPTASGIIARLEKAGYIRRIADKQDRRSIIVELTPDGRKIAGKMRRGFVLRWTSLLERIPQKDAVKYLQILRKLNEAS